jgi:hypothetical protein
MKKFYVLCLFSCSVFSLFAQPKTKKSPAKIKPPTKVEWIEDIPVKFKPHKKVDWMEAPPLEAFEAIGAVDQGQDFRTDSAIGITMIRKSPKAELNLPEFKNKSGDVDLEVYKKVKSLEVRQLVGQMTQIDLALICEGDV